MAMTFPHPIEELSAQQVDFVKKAKAAFMSNSELTQEQKIFFHLITGKGLTGPQALRVHHIYRLASRINELRRELNFPISDERLPSRLALYHFETHHLRTFKKAWEQL